MRQRGTEWVHTIRTIEGISNSPLQGIYRGELPDYFFVYAHHTKMRILWTTIMSFEGTSRHIASQ